MTLPKRKNWEHEGHRVAESRNKEWGYLRIGLNVFTSKFGHENISDVHFVFPRSPKYPGHNTNPRSVKALGILTKAYFTGPNTSIYDLQSPTRSLREQRNFADFRDVEPGREMEEGGNAIVFEAGNYPHTKPHAYTPTGKFHVWLFGPLTLNNGAYGSLFFELNGPFQRNGLYRPLVLQSSSYSEGWSKFIPDYVTRAPDMSWEDYVVEAYNKRLQSVTPVPLPTGAMRWEWNVEVVGANMTAAKAIKMSG